MTVIHVENLGKRYRIGERERYLALRDVLARTVSAPVRMLLGSRNGSSGRGKGVRPIDGHGREGHGAASHIWALKDVSFDVRQGEVVGIIGRNGAGKTTLLKILARVTKPTEGFADVRGRMGSLLEVGTGFHPELTGRENTFLSGAILGMTKTEIQRKFDEIVGFAEVEKFIDTPLKHYSTGMQMRLAFAVAAHLEPEILLVDEVLAVGDAAFQKKCIGKMGDVANEGRTVLFVSHNMHAVKSLVKTGLLMEGGRIIARGDMDGLIERYLQASVAEGDSGKLPLAAHSIHTRDLSIQQATLTRENGEVASEVRIGERLTLTLVLEVHRPASEVRVGVGFHTLDGMRLGTLHHTDCGLPPLDAEPGCYQLSLQFHNPFLPGSYVVSADVISALGLACLDYVPEALRFHVGALGVVDQSHVHYNSGLIRLEGSWTPPVFKTGCMALGGVGSRYSL